MARFPLQRSYYNPVIERMSREELLGLQWRRLKQQLEYAYHRNDFYRRKFEAAKITPDQIKTTDDFQRIPLLNKKDFLSDQEGNPPFGKRLGVPERALVQVLMTSGTSGQGQEVYGMTRADKEFAACWDYGFHWSGLRAGDIAMSTMPNTTSFLAGPDTLCQSILKLRAAYIPLDITVNWERKVQLMQRFNPHWVFIVDLPRMTKTAKDMGLDPATAFPRLKAIFLGFVGGWSAEVIEHYEEIWNTKAYNMYGLTQARTGIGFTCENGMVKDGKYQMYHFQEEGTLLEVLDRETHQPVAPGEEGELVVTNLSTEASPVIRFATNDRVVYAPHNYCDCGRPYAGIMVGSVHRYDDMMKIKGINVWPEAIDLLLLSYEEIAEYQGRVFVTPDGKEIALVQVEFKPNVPQSKKQELLASFPNLLRERAGVGIDVKEADKALPRYEFKARRWTDERITGLKRVAF